MTPEPTNPWPRSSEAEITRDFESYYDAKWIPMHDYFAYHRTRFVDSFKFLMPHVREGACVADLVQPGDGPGPLAEFFGMRWGAVLTLITSDLRQPLDVEDSSSDLVLCTETIEHIKDRDSSQIFDLERFTYSGVESMLAEIGRILRPEGHLFITTPNASSYTHLYKWLMGELPYMDSKHVREYSLDALNEICGKHGLMPDCIEVRNSWGNVPDAVISEFERIMPTFVTKRNVPRGENIFGLYKKSGS